MKGLPIWETYCENTTAVNALRFDLGNGVQVWFSYKTPVAYEDREGVIRVRRNEWGPTTGKHLNAIDGGNKGARIPGPLFESMLDELLNPETAMKTV